MPHDELCGRTHFIRVGIEIGEDLGGDAISFPDKAEEDVFCPDIVMMEAVSLFLGKGESPSRSFGEFFESVCHS